MVSAKCKTHTFLKLCLCTKISNCSVVKMTEARSSDKGVPTLKKNDPRSSDKAALTAKNNDSKQAAGSRDRRPSDKVAAQRKFFIFIFLSWLDFFFQLQSRLRKN